MNFLCSLLCFFLKRQIVVTKPIKSGTMTYGVIKYSQFDLEHCQINTFGYLFNTRSFRF